MYGNETLIYDSLHKQRVITEKTRVIRKETDPVSDRAGLHGSVALIYWVL